MAKKDNLDIPPTTKEMQEPAIYGHIVGIIKDIGTLQDEINNMKATQEAGFSTINNKIDQSLLILKDTASRGYVKKKLEETKEELRKEFKSEIEEQKEFFNRANVQKWLQVITNLATIVLGVLAVIAIEMYKDGLL